MERRPAQLARGVAYSAAHEDHLLNVRAGNMSALPDAPDHFVDWLERNGLGTRATFVPRRVYGAYLREMLLAAAADHADRLTLVEGEAIALERAAGALSLMLSDGAPHRRRYRGAGAGQSAAAHPPGLDPELLPPGATAPIPGRATSRRGCPTPTRWCWWAAA